MDIRQTLPHIDARCEDCGLVGPKDDPTGEKWNALLRVEDVENAFADGVITGRDSFDYIEELLGRSDTKRDLERRMKP